MRSTRYLGAVGLTVALVAGCGAITGEHLPGMGGSGGTGTGGAPSTGGTGGQDGGASCACATIYAPVCGVNGVTYGNSCDAACASVAVAYQGPCVDGGVCSSDTDCLAEASGCCGEQTCTPKWIALPRPAIICNVACPVEIPAPTCACMNHQCVTAGGGTGGTGGAADAGSGASCGELADAYAAALPAAEQCDASDKGACQTAVSEALTPCGSCSVYVNDASELNTIQAAWLQQRCNDVPVLCPASSCLQPTGGVCVAGDGGARCQSAAGALPN